MLAQPAGTDIQKAAVQIMNNSEKKEAFRMSGKHKVFRS
jgi:hypothetical protein